MALLLVNKTYTETSPNVEGIISHLNETFQITVLNITLLNTEDHPLLVSPALTRVMVIVFFVATTFILSVVGLFGNVVSIIIFGKQGVKDSMSLGLLAQSIVDLIIILLSFGLVALLVGNVWWPDHEIDFFAVGFVTFGLYRQMMYNISTSITAFLAVERCVCVVFPFKVKLIFTKSRSMWIIIFCILFHLSYHLPAIASRGLRWEFDSRFNKTRLLFYHIDFIGDRQAIYSVMNIINAQVYTPVVSIVVTICVVTMGRGLYQAFKFRQSVTRVGTKTDKVPETTSSKNPPQRQQGGKYGNTNKSWNTEAKEDTHANDTKAKNNRDKKSQDSDQLSEKDLRLIKTVTFLAVILIIGNIPYVMTVIAILIIPDISFSGRFTNFYLICLGVIDCCKEFSVCVNFFVYMSVNTRFRSMFYEMFGCRQK